MKLKSFTFQTKKPWPLVLGLDIGKRSLKYLLLQRKGSSIRVEAFGKYCLEKGDVKLNNRTDQVLRNLFRKGKAFRRAKVVVGVEGSKLIVKKESFPSLAKKELLQTIFFGMKQEVVGDGDDSDFLYDYISLGPDHEKENHTRYITIGLPEEIAYEKVGHIVANDVVPAKVTPTVLAITNLVRYIPDIQKKNIVCILDIGAHRSMLVIIKQGEMDYFREIVIGGEDFTKAITGIIFHEGRAIQFNDKESVEFKNQYGYPLGFSEGMTFHGAPLSEVGTMMRPVVERLAGEIKRSFGFYKDNSEGGTEPEVLYLIGGGARMKHLPEVLSEKSEIPVSVFPVPEDIRVSGSVNQNEVFGNKFLEQAVSLSLAMESSSEGNLLPQAYSKIHRTNNIKLGFQYAALGVVSILVFLTLMIRNSAQSTKDRLEQFEKRASKLKNTGQLFTALLNEQKILEGKIGSLDIHVKQDNTMIQVLRLISNTMPGDVSLVLLDYGKDEDDSKKKQSTEETVPRKIVLMRGVSVKPPNDVGIYLARFILDLEKSGYFSEVVLKETETPPEQEEYWFEISAYLR
jgi:Tfp pilus assembly PilM family ATPase